MRKFIIFLCWVFILLFYLFVEVLFFQVISYTFFNSGYTITDMLVSIIGAATAFFMDNLFLNSIKQGD